MLTPFFIYTSLLESVMWLFHRSVLQTSRKDPLFTSLIMVRNSIRLFLPYILRLMSNQVCGDPQHAAGDLPTPPELIRTTKRCGPKVAESLRRWMETHFHHWFICQSPFSSQGGKKQACASFVFITFRLNRHRPQQTWTQLSTRAYGWV